MCLLTYVPCKDLPVVTGVKTQQEVFEAGTPIKN